MVMSSNLLRPGDVMQLFYDYAEKDDNFMTEVVLNFVNSAVQRRLGKVDYEWLYDFKSYYVKHDATLFTALVLINRFINLNPKPSIYYELTATELFVVATLAAVKFLQDPDSMDSVTNQILSENLNIELKDIKKAELDFYKALSWNLFVSNSDFVDFVSMKLIAPMRSYIESRNRPKVPSQRSVSQPSNLRTNHLTVRYLRRNRVFAKLPSARSMALAATALLTISYSASLLYHQTGSCRLSSTSLNCDLPDPRLSIPISMFPNQTKCNIAQSALYKPPANEFQSYPLIHYTPRTCGIKIFPKLAQNTTCRNSSLLISGIS
nr:expressed protein [Hymenolepis microstoma]